MARNRPPTVVLLIALILLSLLTVAALRYSLRIAIIPVAAIWMAIGCWSAEIQAAPPTQIALANYADGLSRQIRGRVVRVRELPPERTDSDRDQESGWWPEKEVDEEAAAQGLLSIDIQVDSIEDADSHTKTYQISPEPLASIQKFMTLKPFFLKIPKV